MGSSEMTYELLKKIPQLNTMGRELANVNKLSQDFKDQILYIKNWKDELIKDMILKPKGNILTPTSMAQPGLN